MIAAVTAKDAAASISEVRKDADGSYDALGTAIGQRVFYDVSADLQTVTAGGGPGGPGGGHHGPGAPDTSLGSPTAADGATPSTPAG